MDLIWVVEALAMERCVRNAVDGSNPKGGTMNTLLATATVVALTLGSISCAEAKGCIKGAVVGGVAGHFAGHHGMLGAAAGCLYGRHRANQQERQQEQPQQPNQAHAQGRI